MARKTLTFAHEDARIRVTVLEGEPDTDAIETALEGAGWQGAGEVRGAPAPTGRPRADVDLALLSRLAAIMCTQEDAAGVLGISARTLRRRLKEDDAREAWAQGQAEARASVLRHAFAQSASGRSFPMTIFLLKQPAPYGLGFRDVQTIEMQTKAALRELNTMTDDELLAEEAADAGDDGAAH